MGGSQSKQSEDDISMTNIENLSDVEKMPEDSDNETLTGIDRLFFLLRKEQPDVIEIREILNSGVNLNTPDLAPPLPETDDKVLLEKIKERLSKKTFLGDYVLHLLVDRPESQNTPELVSLVKLIFLKDAPINCRNRLGSTPLHRACAAGNATMAKELISWGAQVDAVNDLQHTCLHMACYAGHTEVVKLLLENGCAKHISFKCSYGVSPIDYILKDEVYQLLKEAHKNSRRK